MITGRVRFLVFLLNDSWIHVCGMCMSRIRRWSFTARLRNQTSVRLCLCVRLWEWVETAAFPTTAHSLPSQTISYQFTLGTHRVTTSRLRSMINKVIPFSMVHYYVHSSTTSTPTYSTCPYSTPHLLLYTHPKSINMYIPNE